MPELLFPPCTLFTLKVLDITPLPSSFLIGMKYTPSEAVGQGYTAITVQVQPLKQVNGQRELIKIQMLHTS